MYNVGLPVYGGSSTHVNMYATTCVSFLENEKKYLYTIHGNNCVRKLLTVDMFAAFIVSK